MNFQCVIGWRSALNYQYSSEKYYDWPSVTLVKNLLISNVYLSKYVIIVMLDSFSVLELKIH
jgi:hypothetical protein